MNTFSFKNMKKVEFNNQAMLSMVPMIRIFYRDHVLYTMDRKYYFLFNSLYFLLQCSHILIREQEWTVRIEKMYPLERSLSCLFMPELYLSWWKRLVLLLVLRYLQEWRGCLFLILEVINFYSQDLCVRKTARNQTKCCKTIGIDLKNVYKERPRTFVRGFSNVICSLGIVLGLTFLSFKN